MQQMDTAAGPGTGTALLTDHYELTMLQAALRDGTAARHSVFEVFARRLPQGRRYGVAAGAGRLLDALERFRFGPDELAFLTSRGVVDDATAAWLAGFRFSGDIWGYAEGDCYFPGSPILRVEGPFGETVLLETLSRLPLTIQGRPLKLPLDRGAGQYAIAGAVSLAAALIAAWLPARKAASVDPVDILRGAA